MHKEQENKNVRQKRAAEHMENTMLLKRCWEAWVRAAKLGHRQERGPRGGRAVRELEEGTDKRAEGKTGTADEHINRACHHRENTGEEDKDVTKGKQETVESRKGGPTQKEWGTHITTVHVHSPFRISAGIRTLERTTW